MYVITVERYHCYSTLSADIKILLYPLASSRCFPCPPPYSSPCPLLSRKRRMCATEGRAAVTVYGQGTGRVSAVPPCSPAARECAIQSLQQIPLLLRYDCYCNCLQLPATATVAAWQTAVEQTGRALAAAILAPVLQAQQQFMRAVCQAARVTAQIRRRPTPRRPIARVPASLLQLYRCGLRAQR